MPAGDLTATDAVEGNIIDEVRALRREVAQLKNDLADLAAALEGRYAPAQTATYTVTNPATDRSYDANATTTAELADVLATLLSDLGMR